MKSKVTCIEDYTYIVEGQGLSASITAGESKGSLYTCLKQIYLPWLGIGFLQHPSPTSQIL